MLEQGGTGRALELLRLRSRWVRTGVAWPVAAAAIALAASIMLLARASARSCAVHAADGRELPCQGAIPIAIILVGGRRCPVITMRVLSG
jgi:hypothetical protein